MPDLEGLRDIGALVVEVAIGRPSRLSRSLYDGIRRGQWSKEQRVVEAAGGRASLI